MTEVNSTPVNVITDDVVAARHVDGVCPACKTQELYLAPIGQVMCSHPDCPDTAAASALLDGRYTPPEVGEHDLRINLNRPYIIALPGNGSALLVTDDMTETNTGWSRITRAVVCARLDAISDMIDQEGTP